MKVRASVVAVAVLLSVVYAGLVFAQDSPAAQKEFQTKWGTAEVRQFQGTVVSHDVPCHCIIVKGAEGNLVLQDDYAKFDQEYDNVKGLKLGKPASGSYKTIDEINYATQVHQK
ncbi:MAG TPA: hypothetical protein VKF36_06070 [Syntrophorhabdales bacterium]|nr:hypothetical protein [Syntrophorhabdales bacterium]